MDAKQLWEEAAKLQETLVTDRISACSCRDRI